MLHSHVGIEEEHYNNLKDMTAAADAAVVGVIVDANEGRRFGTDEPVGEVTYVNLTVEVKDVLSESRQMRLQPVDHPSRPVPGTELKVEYILHDRSSLGAIRSLLPSSEYMLFLRNKGLAAASSGNAEAPGVPIAQSLGFYRPVSSQGVLKNSDGRVALPLVGPEEGDMFPRQLAGIDFAAIVKDVRSFRHR